MTEVVLPNAPRLETKPALRLVGFARVFRWESVQEISSLWQKAGPWLEQISGDIAGEAFGAMYVPAPGSGDFGYLAGIDAGADVVLTPELSQIDIPAAEWAVFSHDGGLMDWPKTIDFAMQKWLPGSGRSGPDPAPGVVTVMERYGPGFDPVTGRGDMECWVPLKS